MRYARRIFTVKILRSRCLAALAAALSLPAIATIRAADAPAAGASASPSADSAAAWSRIETLLQDPKLQSPETAAQAISLAEQALADFRKQFPNDPRKWDARLLQAQFALVLKQLGQSNGSVQATVDDLHAIVKASDAPEDAKNNARSLLLQYYALNGTPQEIAQELKDFDHAVGLDQLPPQFRLMLAKKLAAADPALAKQLQESAEQSEPGAKLLNKPLDLKFTAVDGTEVDLSKMKGKVVLVDFWATWCGPCMAEVPTVVSVYQKLHAKGFDIVGISLDKDKDRLLEVTKAKGMVWPQYFDGQGWSNKISSQFGITSIPTMWLVNKKGDLVDIEARDDLEAKVVKLLAE